MVTCECGAVVTVEEFADNGDMCATCLRAELDTYAAICDAAFAQANAGTGGDLSISESQTYGDDW